MNKGLKIEAVAFSSARWRLRLVAAIVAIFAIACADVGGGGGGAADSGGGGGGGSDAAAGDGGGGGGSDTGGGGGGQGVTIKEMQEAMEKLDCTAGAFTNGPKGVKLEDVVIATPTIFKVDKAGKLDAVYVQTKGGGLWNGIYLVANNGGELGKVKVGSVVTVEGEVSDYYCATQIKATKITVGTATELPVAVTLTLDQLEEKAAEETKEAAEGVLVSIEGVTVSDNDPLGTDGKPHGQFYVGKDKDDKAVLIAPGFGTTFSKQGADGNYHADVKVGQKFKSIRGIFTYAFSKWQLVPVGDAGLDAE